MQIQQLQVSFDAREDRLLLRIATAEREEILVALTRRLVKALWPYLQKMLNGHLGGSASPRPMLPGATASNPDAPKGLGTASFSEPYQDKDLSHPLGIIPLLAMESRLQPIDGPACRISLGEIKARKVSFDCDRDLMEALCAMIRATTDKAGWDIDLDTLVANTPVEGDADGTHTLH